MALQLRRFSVFTRLQTVAPSRISPPMLHNRTMQSFSCNFRPHSLFAQGGRIGKPIQLSITNVFVNVRNRYTSRIPICICSRLRIHTFCFRSSFGYGNGPRLNSLAHEHMKMRSFSSKRKRKLKFQDKSKEVCDGASAGGDRTGDGHSALREHHWPKKRDKSVVCNSINGQINATVSNPNASLKKGKAKTSMSVSNTCKDVENKNKVTEDTSGNKGATKKNANTHDANVSASNTGKDAASKEKVVEDGSSNKGITKGNDNVQAANTPVRRNQTTSNKKRDGRKLVQANTGNESVKKNGKVQGAKTAVEMRQWPENDKQDHELSCSSPAAAVTTSSNKLSKENSQSVNGASCLNKSNNPDSSMVDFKVQKQIRPLYPPSGKSVVVVESVTKAKVIQNYLGNMYEVLPSHGHLRDLAGRSGSVRPDDDFSMVWEVPASAWTHLKSIKLALNGAENLILASDPDCEGETIAWHVIEMLQQQDSLAKDITVARVVFYEITESAIKSALQSPREIDKNLVNAYLARRALDYLIGFKKALESPGVNKRSLYFHCFSGFLFFCLKKLICCESEREMQAAAVKCKAIQNLGNPSNPLFLSMFHSTPASLAKWKTKWDVSKGEGSNQQPSKSYVKYAVRQKRADAKRALRNLLLNGKPSKHYIKDETLAWGGEETSSMRKDNSHPHSKNSKRSKSRNADSKCWQNKKSFYGDEADYERSEPKFSATFAGHRCYTWSYDSWENSNFQSTMFGFEWRDEPKWEKEKKRAWNYSDVEDSTNSGSCYHRIALGLPPTGPLKLDDVKSAFRASALKWHPDKHQGPSQALAGEKFKLCVEAYNSLRNALKSTI